MAANEPAGSSGYQRRARRAPGLQRGRLVRKERLRAARGPKAALEDAPPAEEVASPTASEAAPPSSDGSGAAVPRTGLPDFGDASTEPVQKLRRTRRGRGKLAIPNSG
eukprot:5878161-Lingulodinium_polyedra.AAC.1